jgi:hypothetical protein
MRWKQNFGRHQTPQEPSPSSASFQMIASRNHRFRDAHSHQTKDETVDKEIKSPIP